MAILNIIEEGDDTLRKKCRFVERIDDRIIRLLDDMRETMLIAGGIGLAAPQVGVLRRVAIVDNGERIIELINPEIIEERSEEHTSELQSLLSISYAVFCLDRKSVV